MAVIMVVIATLDSFSVWLRKAGSVFEFDNLVFNMNVIRMTEKMLFENDRVHFQDGCNHHENRLCHFQTTSVLYKKKKKIFCTLPLKWSQKILSGYKVYVQIWVNSDSKVHVDCRSMCICFDLLLYITQVFISEISSKTVGTSTSPAAADVPPLPFTLDQNQTVVWVASSVDAIPPGNPDKIFIKYFQ